MVRRSADQGILLVHCHRRAASSLRRLTRASRRRRRRRRRLSVSRTAAAAAAAAAQQQQQQQNHDDANYNTSVLPKLHADAAAAAAMKAAIGNDAMLTADTNRHVEQLRRSHIDAERTSSCSLICSRIVTAQSPSAGGWCAIERPTVERRTYEHPTVRMPACNDARMF